MPSARHQKFEFIAPYCVSFTIAASGSTQQFHFHHSKATLSFPAWSSIRRAVLRTFCFRTINLIIIRVILNWPEPGTDFAVYHLREVLGQGAYGHVYRALEANGREVAIKIQTLLVPQDIIEEKSRANQVAILQSLHHVRGTTDAYFSGVHEETWRYMTMQALGPN